MSDERLGQAVGAWLRDVDSPSNDPRGDIQLVMRQIRVTGQVRRSLRLPAIRRATRSLSATHTTELPLGPILAANGQTPTVLGRTSSMLSPVKAIAAGVIAVAVGTAFLIAQPFGQHSTTVPAAEGDAVSMDAAWVMGTLRPDENSFSPFVNNCAHPTRAIDDEPVHETGYYCETQLWETNDPRLSGTATLAWNADVYRLGPAATVTSGGVREVVNDAGRWQCSSPPTVAQGSGVSVLRYPDTVICVGHEGYAGLTAVLNVDDGDMDTPGSVEGLVFAGTVPTAPESVTE